MVENRTHPLKETVPVAVICSWKRALYLFARLAEIRGEREHIFRGVEFRTDGEALTILQGTADPLEATQSPSPLEVQNEPGRSCRQAIPSPAEHLPGAPPARSER